MGRWMERLCNRLPWRSTTSSTLVGNYLRMMNTRKEAAGKSNARRNRGTATTAAAVLVGIAVAGFGVEGAAAAEPAPLTSTEKFRPGDGIKGRAPISAQTKIVSPRLRQVTVGTSRKLSATKGSIGAVVSSAGAIYDFGRAASQPAPWTDVTISNFTSRDLRVRSTSVNEARIVGAEQGQVIKPGEALPVGVQLFKSVVALDQDAQAMVVLEATDGSGDTNAVRIKGSWGNEVVDRQYSDGSDRSLGDGKGEYAILYAGNRQIDSVPYDKIAGVLPSLGDVVLYDATVDDEQSALELDASRLTSGETMWTEPLTSFNGRYRLMPTATGVKEQVLNAKGEWEDGSYQRPYEWRNEVPSWDIKTGVAGTRMTMQPDGNLVIQSPTGQPIRWSGTQGNPGAYLQMQDDGNVVIYSADGRVLKHQKSGLWAQ